MPLVQLQQNSLQGSTSKYPDSAGQGSGHGTRGGKLVDPSGVASVIVVDASGAASVIVVVIGASVVVVGASEFVVVSWVATMADTKYNKSK